MTERVAIVGSRHWSDPHAIWRYVQDLPAGTVIVSGGATGADTMAAIYAQKRGLEVKVHWPQWNAHASKYRAAYERNKAIVDDCDRLVAFWENRTPGTRMTIAIAREAGKPVEIIER